jgi:DNA-binding response OmpR family regulator
MKTIVILDSELNSTHPMEAVMGRRGYVVYRSATTAEAIALCESTSTPIDLLIAEVPLTGSASQTEPATKIRKACPDLPILLVSDLSLDRWTEDDFQQFGKLLAGRADLLLKPLSQASFITKVNSLLYTVSYKESRVLYEGAKSRRSEAVAAGS